MVDQPYEIPDDLLDSEEWEENYYIYMEDMIHEWIEMCVPSEYQQQLHEAIGDLEMNAYFDADHIEGGDSYGVNLFSWGGTVHGSGFWNAVQQLWADDPGFTGSIQEEERLLSIVEMKLGRVERPPALISLLFDDPRLFV